MKPVKSLIVLYVWGTFPKKTPKRFPERQCLKDFGHRNHPCPEKLVILIVFDDSGATFCPTMTQNGPVGRDLRIRQLQPNRKKERGDY